MVIEEDPSFLGNVRDSIWWKGKSYPQVPVCVCVCVCVCVRQSEVTANKVNIHICRISGMGVLRILCSSSIC